MGEISDMMLNGELCQGCGEYMDIDLENGEMPPGHPVYCLGCSCEDDGDAACPGPKKKDKPASKVPCPHCDKNVKPSGLEHHIRDVHGAISFEPAALSKREHFAGLVIQGLLSYGAEGLDSPEETAELAVDIADALIAELEKPK